MLEYKLLIYQNLIALHISATSASPPQIYRNNTIEIHYKKYTMCKMKYNHKKS